MTRNVDVHKDADGNTVIEADEVYFEVERDQPIPTVADVEADFDLYWNNGVNWPVIEPEPTPEELMRKLIEAQAERITMLEDCLLEMSEIVYE